MAEPSLEMLQAMMQRMLEGQRRMTDEMTEIKQRLTTVEISVGNLSAAEQSHYGQTMQRLDRFDARLERIERRLDLTEAPA